MFIHPEDDAKILAVVVFWKEKFMCACVAHARYVEMIVAMLLK